MTIEMLEFFMIGFLLLLTPGFAFLFITRIWRDWPALQRWITAIGISLAFYPVLFYLAREIFPNLHIGVRKLWALLILFTIITLVYFWKERKSLFRLEPLEWVAVGIIIITVVTRFWVIADRPFPAWSDALHHVLITQLTAQNGQLPYSLEPYAPTPLDMYHLGLYSLTGPVEIMTGLPAHTSFLWVSQLLNGLCGLGIYLFLDRKVGRRGALIGLVAIGLWSFQPAWYVNWSRTTSLAANTLLLISALVTWEALEQLMLMKRERPLLQSALFAITGLMNASVFLFHFRVAGYYLPLLIIICAYLLIRSIKIHQTGRYLLYLAIIAIISLLLITPAIGRVLSIYLELKSSTAPISESSLKYFRMPPEQLFQIGIQLWLFILAVVMLILSILFRNMTVWLILIWIAVLGIEAYAYVFKIRLLMFTNASGIAVILYLPIVLLIGIGFGELFKWIETGKKQDLSNTLLATLVISGIFFVPDRVNGVEDYRYFVKDADQKAMNWVMQNTPKDSNFAINTFMWLGESPHGIDGGYWIPYFTKRFTTASTMLYDLGPQLYAKLILDQSQAVKELNDDPSQIQKLCEMGVDYLYLGINDQTDQLNPDILAKESGMLLVYQERGISILQTCVK